MANGIIRSPHPRIARIVVWCSIVLLLAGAASAIWLFRDTIRSRITGVTAPPPAPQSEQVLQEARTVTVLPPGKQTYTFSHGNAVVGPKPMELTVDPLTPPVDGKQTVTITASHSADITTAAIFVTTDTKKDVKHSLTRIRGTPTAGVWQGAWTLDDTYEKIYTFRLYLTSAQDTYDENVWFR